VSTTTARPTTNGSSPRNGNGSSHHNGNGSAPSAGTASHKQGVRGVYERIAGEYDHRIPGRTPVDHRFTDSEMNFLLSRVQPGDVVLDMGCGTGRFTVPMAEAGADVTGFDISPAMLAQLRATARERGQDVRTCEGDMAHLPFDDDTFDVVTSMLALMHIPIEDRQQVFLEVARVLKPGGRLVLGVKNEQFERMSRVDRFASVDITDVENKELIFTETEDGQILTAPWHSFAPDDLQRLTALSGLSVVSLRGNSTIVAWIADEILSDPATYSAICTLEELLGDAAPFNRLGYHLLAEAVKPLR
jgi:ubiquinone/menaquinone biosynthesis C-methylase UbiE